MSFDRHGRNWIAPYPSGCDLAVFQSQTQIRFPDATVGDGGTCSFYGSSIDRDGRVWVVGVIGTTSGAWKINPTTYAREAAVGGLIDPNTTSGMAGVGLDVVVLPPAG